jgi:hypothetical protein
MRNLFLALSIAIATQNLLPWPSFPQRAGKCETYEDDCGVDPIDPEDPQRPGDPDGPDEPGDGL